MPRKYSFESEPDEQEPLDNPNYQHNQHSPVSRQFQQTQPNQQHSQVRHPQRLDLDDSQEPYYDEPPAASSPRQQRQQRRQQQQQQQQFYDEPVPSSTARSARGPAAHPDSAYRQYAQDRIPGAATRAAPAPAPRVAPAAAAAVPVDVDEADLVSPVTPPPPPPHRDAAGPQQSRYPPPAYPSTQEPPSNVTPGADNFSESAAGGMAGLAYGVAERNPRESGMEAMRSLQQQGQQNFQPSPPPGYPQQAYQGAVPHPQQQQQQQQYGGAYSNAPYDMADPQQPSPQRLRPNAYGAVSGSRNVDRDSRSSLQQISNSGYPPGSATPGSRTPSRSPQSFANDAYADDPYQRYSVHDAQLGYVNPNEIEDDGDDGLEYGRKGARTSMLSLAGYSSRSSRNGSSNVLAPAAIGAATVGAAAAAVPAAAAVLSHEGHGRVASGGARYNALHNGHSEYLGAGGAPAAAGYGGGGGGAGGGGAHPMYNLGGSGSGYPEKSAWLAQESRSSKRWRWAIIIGIALAVIAGIVCGIVFGVVLKKNNGGNGSSQQSAAGDTAANGDLSLNSPEIQALLNNKNLHKVFPGIDYTPINTQYPDCLSNPPSQNNVTRDVAVLSQLTNTIRLYGTDCNQTEMTIHAISQLKMQDTVKIWMGVWQDNNHTTNARQLAQMWDILEKYGGEPFKGLIVANEILFRQQMTTTELADLLESVRTNLTSMNISLPVATSDLGTVWDSQLAQASDYVMANIHPFFGGVNADQAAAWTWNFWETNNGAVFKSDISKNIISETGWPSTGGTDCGTGSTETSCPNAAVAGISQMNTFMADWVCAALTNGTQYFWFEAFDEPWKILYDNGTQNWEDHWGIMDVNRNLKPGVQIPDCGGKTVS